VAACDTRDVSGDDLTRVDVWLWAVRVYKTRAQSKDACLRGRVRIDGDVAKPAGRVRRGARVSTRRGDRLFELEVVEPISKRVGAERATECFIDHSPPPEPRADRGTDSSPFAARERGAGRPTKRDRRRLDRVFGRKS